jgi:hypothetical protein
MQAKTGLTSDSKDFTKKIDGVLEKMFMGMSVLLLGLLVSFVGIFAFVISSIVQGYVLVILWGWFVMPFFSAPKLSIPIAIGLTIVGKYFTHQYNPSDANRLEKIYEAYKARKKAGKEEVIESKKEPTQLCVVGPFTLRMKPAPFRSFAFSVFAFALEPSMALSFGWVLHHWLM